MSNVPETSEHCALMGIAMAGLLKKIYKKVQSFNRGYIARTTWPETDKAV